MLSVIEMDLPWDDAQVEAYGNTFKAWSDDDIDVALTAIRDYAYEQVNLRGLPFLLLLSQIYHSLAQRSGLQRLLAKDCQSIYDFILYNCGIQHTSSFLSRCFEFGPNGLRSCFRKHDRCLEKEHNASAIQVLFFHRHFALVVQRVVWAHKAAKQLFV